MKLRNHGNARCVPAVQTGDLHLAESTARLEAGPMAEVVPAPRGPNWDSALRILAAVCAVAFIAVLNFVPVAANDVWLKIKIGSMVWHDRVIPDTVLFTFTPLRHNAFNVHEWLPSVLLYLLQRWLCYLLARRLSGSTGVALLLAMGRAMPALIPLRRRSCPRWRPPSCRRPAPRWARSGSSTETHAPALRRAPLPWRRRLPAASCHRPRPRRAADRGWR